MEPILSKKKFMLVSSIIIYLFDVHICFKKPNTLCNTIFTSQSIFHILNIKKLSYDIQGVR